MLHLSSLLFFVIALLYYHINLNSSIMFCLSCGDIYLSYGVLLLASLEGNSFEDSFDAFVILSATLLPIKSPGASTVF